MGLSTTLSIAQSALATNAALSSVVSRNIAGVNDPGYSRKIAALTPILNGTSTVSVSRATDTALYNNLLSATSDAASSSALAAGLDTLEQTVGLSSSTSSSGTTSSTSPAALIGTLTGALQQYAAAPDDSSLGTAVITAANQLTNALQTSSATVQQVRAQADQDMASAVSSANAILKQLASVNTSLVKAQSTGADSTDLQDQRDTLLLSLSNYVGISTTGNADSSTAVYTDSGAVLVQGSTARTLSFTPTATYTAGTAGAPVMVDGVALTGASATMGLKSGSIAGLAQLRDTTTVAYQDQLDQIAGGLVTTFAESDQSGGSAPTLPGLFTYGGAPDLPTGTVAGLAGTISVNANADPAQGGSLSNLRDGTIGDPGNAAYNGNTAGAASYATSLNGLLGSLDASQSFDAGSGGAASSTLAGYATSSVSWLEAARQSATTTSTDRSAVVSQTTATLSSSTGVNLDEQLSKMLDIEHSYQASAELMSTVNSMFTTLFSDMQG